MDEIVLETMTVQRIYEAYEARTEHPRAYLGASIIGEPCTRKLWYAFRWAHPPEQKSGRVRRLLDTGHSQEDRMIADLRATGAVVNVVIPGTTQQFGFKDIAGHFAGHMDGQAIGILEAPKKWHVVEAKTHNEKSFGKLRRDGVIESKPLHYAQMQVYMHYTGFQRAIYIAVNKNTDELFTDRFRYDPIFATRLVEKARQIITAPKPPVRMHDDPDSKLAWECGFCPARGICHERHFAERNCRTCCHATPLMDGDGAWICELHDFPLDTSFQREGCDNHIFIPDLVPGTPVALNKRQNWIRYRLDDGSDWADGNITEGHHA